MADLSCFNTKDKADEGVILPVKIDGVKMPLALKIYGSDSDVVKEYEMKKIRKLGIGKKGKTELDEDDISELLDDRDNGVIVRIGGIYDYDWKEQKTTDEDTIIDGKVLKNDKESYAYLIEKIPALKDWVMKESNERGNFLSEGKKN